MKTTNLKKFSVTLALLFSVAACSNPNQTTPSNNTSSNNSNSANVVSNLKVSTASQEISNDLTSYSDEEATFSDTETLANEESGFSVKALGDLLDRAKLGRPEKAEKPEMQGSDKKPAKEDRLSMRARLEASGAFTKDADGKMVIDKDKLKATVKTFVDEKRTEMKDRMEKIKDKLKEKKEVAKEKAEKLKNKKSQAKKSNVVETTNADGSISKTMTVEFTKDNMTKENTITKTTKDGKLVSISHVLSMKAKNFTKNSSRITTFNEDGSKQVVTESTTTWDNGRKREVHETRTIDAKGEGTGNGTITVTDKDGKVTTKTLDTKISASSSGDKVSATVKDGNTTVTLSDNASATATLSVKEGEKTTTAEVEVETAAEAS